MIIEFEALILTWIVNMSSSIWSNQLEAMIQCANILLYASDHQSKKMLFQFELNLAFFWMLKNWLFWNGVNYYNKEFCFNILNFHYFASLIFHYILQSFSALMHICMSRILWASKIHSTISTQYNTNKCVRL